MFTNHHNFFFLRFQPFWCECRRFFVFIDMEAIFVYVQALSWHNELNILGIPKFSIFNLVMMCFELRLETFKCISSPESSNLLSRITSPIGMQGSWKLQMIRGEIGSLCVSNLMAEATILQFYNFQLRYRRRMIRKSSRVYYTRRGKSSLRQLEWSQCRAYRTIIRRLLDYEWWNWFRCNTDELIPTIHPPAFLIFVCVSVTLTYPSFQTKIEFWCLKNIIRPWRETIRVA